MPSLAFCLCLLFQASTLLQIPSVQAIKVNIVHRPSSHRNGHNQYLQQHQHREPEPKNWKPLTRIARQLYEYERRADITGESVNTSNGSVPVANTQNAEYIANINLGGKTIPVVIDTGSSDLWVTGTVPNTTDSGKSAKLQYAVGQAAGSIKYAPLILDNYTVPDQAFLLVNDTSTFSTDISAQGYNGLIGLGPNSGSTISRTIKAKDNKGDAVLDRIFQLNLTTQNYITFLLDRRGDPTQSFSGQLTISELVAGFENVTGMPKLDVVKVPGLTDEDQHWSVYTDKDVGLIGPDGNPIVVDSIVPKAPDGQMVVVFDSGFTLPQVPRKVSDAIYGRVQGAKWDSTNQLWTIPCDQLLNISFNFGGQNYPIHPLDVSSNDFDLKDDNGNTVCAGAFQPITSAFSLLGEYDMILGMGFLRNTYTLLDFGNFVSSTTSDRGKPYVQLLSVTSLTEAHSDFVKARLNGVDTTSDPSKNLLPASQGQSSPESESEKKAHLEAKILSRWPYILLGGLILLILVLVLCIWKCCCRRGVKSGKNRGTLGGGRGVTGSGIGGSGGGGVGGGMLPLGPISGKLDSSYRPLHDPAPPPVLPPSYSAVNLNAYNGGGGGGYGGGYNDPYHRDYSASSSPR